MFNMNCDPQDGHPMEIFLQAGFNIEMIGRDMPKNASFAGEKCMRLLVKLD